MVLSRPNLLITVYFVLWGSVILITLVSVYLRRIRKDLDFWIYIKILNLPLIPTNRWMEKRLSKKSLLVESIADPSFKLDMYKKEMDFKLKNVSSKKLDLLELDKLQIAEKRMLFNQGIRRSLLIGFIFLLLSSAFASINSYVYRHALIMAAEIIIFIYSLIYFSWVSKYNSLRKNCELELKNRVYILKGISVERLSKERIAKKNVKQKTLQYYNNLTRWKLIEILLLGLIVTSLFFGIRSIINKTNTLILHKETYFLGGIDPAYDGDYQTYKIIYNGYDNLNVRRSGDGVFLKIRTFHPISVLVIFNEGESFSETVRSYKKVPILSRLSYISFNNLHKKETKVVLTIYYRTYDRIHLSHLVDVFYGVWLIITIAQFKQKKWLYYPKVKISDYM